MPPDPAVYTALLDDLAAEQGVLDQLVADLTEAEWGLPTPADGWAVRDQISHLAFFDEIGTVAINDPDGFAARMAAASTAADPMAEHLARGRALAGVAVLSWWRTARAAAAASARGLALDRRVLWFGPPMSPMSFVSARLMETWAHGLDVADGLGVAVEATDRLRHIAHLGVQARGFSYVVRGLEPPPTPVRVELEAPSGTVWVWGEAAAPDTVRGSALGFCQVVTQRRHLDDTDLTVSGDGASTWMAIAQAFAGPPGRGRTAAV